MRTAHNAWHRCAQNADHLAHNTPFSPFFAEVVCTVGTTQPQTAISSSPNGGNGVTRTSTRRRHADSQLLMLQNPHHSQPCAPGCIEDQRRVNFFALIPTVGPRGANFFACMTQPRGDVETDITSAPEKRTKNAHFSPAQAMAVSSEARPARAKATPVSNHRATSPAAARRNTHGRRRHHGQPNVAHHLARSFFEMPQKRCNSNDTNSMFE